MGWGGRSVTRLDQHGKRGEGSSLSTTRAGELLRHGATRPSTLVEQPRLGERTLSLRAQAEGPGQPLAARLSSRAVCNTSGRYLAGCPDPRRLKSHAVFAP